MAATSRGATLLGPDKLEIREYPIPDIGADGGLVKVEMGGVCGSDFKYLHGGKNGLPYPLILGHEILGRVEKLGKEAAAIHGIKEGDRIIMKGAKGCGRCAHCRRGAARFCKARIGYGGQTTCANPPHLFGGFADYLYLVPDILVTKVSNDLPGRSGGAHRRRHGQRLPMGRASRRRQDGRQRADSGAGPARPRLHFRGKDGWRSKNYHHRIKP